jgi:hypothetical protein
MTLAQNSLSFALLAADNNPRWLDGTFQSPDCDPARAL